MSDEHTDIPQEPAMPQRPAPGHDFTVHVPATTPLAEFRKMIREKLKFDGHIKAKIGPFSVHGSKIEAPIAAVDDPYLDGSFHVQLSDVCIGWCVYMGVLKEDSLTPADTAEA